MTTPQRGTDGRLRFCLVPVINGVRCQSAGLGYNTSGHHWPSAAGVLAGCLWLWQGLGKKEVCLQLEIWGSFQEHVRQSKPERLLSSRFLSVSRSVPLLAFPCHLSFLLFITPPSCLSRCVCLTLFHSLMSHGHRINKKNANVHGRSSVNTAGMRGNDWQERVLFHNNPHREKNYTQL